MIKHVLQWFTNRFSHKSNVIQGSCNQCGQCCRNLLLYDGSSVVSTHEQFDQLLARQPHYAIFEPQYQETQSASLFFSCRHIGEDNHCQIYTNRPVICDDYPNPKMFLHGARLPESCSYELVPQQRFSHHMTQQQQKLKSRQ